MKGCNVGYIRVSSEDQNPERQLEGIEIHHKFMDKVSGKSMDRPKLEEMLQFIRMGDQLYVHSMDRLARNLDDLRKLVALITDRGVTLHFVKENMMFTKDQTPMSILMLSVMGAFAEFERAIIRERQREGIELAKKKGVYTGRKKVLTEIEQKELKKRIDTGACKSKLAREFGIGRSTMYKYFKENNNGTRLATL